VEAIGFGWINLRRTGEASGDARLEEWPWEVAQPLGAEVAAHFDRVAWSRATDDAALRSSRLVVPADVRQETVGAPGAADPAQVLLRRQTGMRRARRVSTAVAAFVGACDGELTVGQLGDAVAQVVGSAPDPATVRELVVEGFLDTDWTG
jgi:hypothetical protein